MRDSLFTILSLATRCHVLVSWQKALGVVKSSTLLCVYVSFMLEGAVKDNTSCLLLCLAGCNSSLIKEVHHFRILGEHQVGYLLFCRHRKCVKYLNQCDNSFLSLIAPSPDSCQMCLCLSMSGTSSMVLRNACWGAGDSCVPHLGVGRGLSHLITTGGWNVTDRSAVVLSFAETAGRATMRGCVQRHCLKPLLKAHRWVNLTCQDGY